MQSLEFFGGVCCALKHWAGALALMFAFFAVGSASAASIDAGGEHTCAINGSGGLRCWGRNFDGELGTGGNTEQHLPVSVRGMTGGVFSVSTGNHHTCAVLTSGGLRCWGDNFRGQVGDGSNADRFLPVKVKTLTSNVSQVVVGAFHSCAIAAGIKCWGSNTDGQLGDGTQFNSNIPVAVSGLQNVGVDSLAAGLSHTCAVTNTGAVKCWGFNLNGQLGNGTQDSALTPTNVSGLGSGVAFVTAGDNHTCALTTGGAVKCWGDNANGQLGDGTTAQRLAPVGVKGLTSGVLEIAAGGSFTCARLTGGRMKCWGANFNGQLGDGTTSQRNQPVGVAGLTSGVDAIAAGNTHACAVIQLQPALLKCWGFNGTGQLGDGTITERHAPVNVRRF
jgi:alpha-tubulin suppressor-like RCC1 family protein